MQSEVFQAFICYNGLQFMKTPNSKLEYCEKVFISVSHNHKIITNNGLKYFTLHVMSLYNILVSAFKWNY